jgi:hypothetical protein
MSKQEETVDKMEERLREMAHQVWRALLEPFPAPSAEIASRKAASRSVSGGGVRPKAQPAREGRRRSTGKRSGAESRASRRN